MYTCVYVCVRADCRSKVTEVDFVKQDTVIFVHVIAGASERRKMKMYFIEDDTKCKNKNLCNKVPYCFGCLTSHTRPTNHGKKNETSELCDRNA